MHDENCFITLTYSDDKLPELGSLHLPDWQTFAKKFRKKLGPFRFYHCGEYGEATRRPHYHALIFGLNFPDMKFYQTTQNGDRLYTSELLESVWGKGHCPIGQLTYESAAYVARYCMTTSKPEAHTRVNTSTGELVNVKPPYTTMSRRPGIGKTWLEKYKSDVYPSDEVIVNSKSTRPPRFYDYVLEATDPAALAKIKKQRVKKGRRHKKNNTPERLAIREHIQELKLKQLPRPSN